MVHKTPGDQPGMMTSANPIFWVMLALRKNTALDFRTSGKFPCSMRSDTPIAADEK
jgi:hypothetical protein